MVSIFYPTFTKQGDNDEMISLCSYAYMPNGTAEVLGEEFKELGVNRSFTQLSTPVIADVPLLLDSDKGFPVILISPGAGAERFLYTAIAESVSSNGYIVVCMDHPYDAEVVELLNGTLIRGPLDLPNRHDLLRLGLATRVKDSSFVLDALSEMDFFRHDGAKIRGLNVSRAGIMGHSLGGATTSQAMAMDTRMAAGVSLDGPFWGSMNVTGLDRPILVIGGECHNENNGWDWWKHSWNDTWPKLRAWKRLLLVEGTVHASFSDLPTLIDVLDIRQDLPKNGSDDVGSIMGKRMLEIETAYITTFFDMFLKGKNSTLFDGNDTTYPEVLTIQN